MKNTNVRPRYAKPLSWWKSRMKQNAKFKNSLYLRNSGDLVARKARLTDRSLEQLRADLDALMNERRDQKPVEGDELPADFN